MDPARLPPISRRLDFLIQAMEDICKRLDRIADSLVNIEHRAKESVGHRPLMNLKQAAAALGVGVGTMRALAGRDVAYVKVGRRVAFTPSDLERFVARNRQDWGSSRWFGRGQPRFGDQKRYDDAYLERLNRPDPSERMPPLDDAFTEALKANFVDLNIRRALRLAGINSMEKARTYTAAELMRIKGIGGTVAPRILRAIGMTGGGRRRRDAAGYFEAGADRPPSDATPQPPAPGFGATTPP